MGILDWTVLVDGLFILEYVWKHPNWKENVCPVEGWTSWFLKVQLEIFQVVDKRKTISTSKVTRRVRKHFLVTT